MNLSNTGVRNEGVILSLRILSVNINPDSSKQSLKGKKKCFIQWSIKNWIHHNVLTFYHYHYYYCSVLFHKFNTCMYLICAALALHALVISNIQYLCRYNTVIFFQSHHKDTPSLQWRHNERDGVSNHQPQDCSLKFKFRRRSKKTFKLRVTSLCVGNSPVNSPHKGPVTRKMFPFDDVIIIPRTCHNFVSGLELIWCLHV